MHLKGFQFDLREFPGGLGFNFVIICRSRTGTRDSNLETKKQTIQEMNRGLCVEVLSDRVGLRENLAFWLEELKWIKKVCVSQFAQLKKNKHETELREQVLPIYKQCISHTKRTLGIR